jgi:CHAT domain-containing protein
LDYQGEIDKILNIITESKKAFNAEFKATDFETFIDAIRSYPKILHISSHGVIKENKDKKMFYLC